MFWLVGDLQNSPPLRRELIKRANMTTQRTLLAPRKYEVGAISEAVPKEQRSGLKSIARVNVRQLSCRRIIPSRVPLLGRREPQDVALSGNVWRWQPISSLAVASPQLPLIPITTALCPVQIKWAETLALDRASETLPIL